MDIYCSSIPNPQGTAPKYSDNLVHHPVVKEIDVPNYLYTPLGANYLHNAIRLGIYAHESPPSWKERYFLHTGRETKMWDIEGNTSDPMDGGKSA